MARRLIAWCPVLQERMAGGRKKLELRVIFRINLRTRNDWGQRKRQIETKRTTRTFFSRLLECTAYFRVTLAHGPQTLRSARQVPGIARRNGSAVGNWRRSTIIVSLKSKWPDQAGQRQLASAADANWRMSVAHLPSLKISQSRSCRLRFSYRWR